MRISDWSSDVCSSDLVEGLQLERVPHAGGEQVCGGAFTTGGQLRRPQQHPQAPQLDRIQAPEDSEERIGDLRRRPLVRALHGEFDHGEQVADRALSAEGTPRAARARRAVSCRSEEHTSELQSLMSTSYAVLCL